MSRLVGYGVSQVPINGMLGGMAYQDPINVTVNNISVGGGTLTGTASQPLQVTGGGYVSGGLGVGVTNPVGQLQVSSGPVIIGTATSTGTASQPLQVTGGGYVSGNLGIGITTPNANGAKLQTSDGLTFPATAVASADPNTLDDYEEGTWTPTQGAGLTVVGTFSSVGTYIKIGKQVLIEGVVTGSTSVSVPAVNSITIGGIPWTSGFTRPPGLAGNEAIGASASFQVVGANIYFMETMAATTNIRFVATYSI